MPILKKNTLLRHIVAGSLIFYALSGLVSLFNYAYYPIISRAVSTTTYGEVQFLLSLFAQLSVGFVALNLMSIILTARYQGEERSKALRSLNTLSITVILVIVLIGCLVLGLNKSAFGFASVIPIITLGISLLINVPFTVTMGRLQGEQQYVLSGVLGAVAAFLRLAFAFGFVLLGFGTSGAMAGMTLGMLTALAILFMYEKRHALHLNQRQLVARRSFKRLTAYYVDHITHLKDEKALLWTALITMAVMTLLSTSDVFLSKLILSAHEAGQYAAVATIAKIILYATTPLLWLALPLALTDMPQAVKKVRHYVALTGLIGGTLFIPFALAPDFIIRSLLGIDAAQYTLLLPLASAAMVVVSLAFIVTAISLCRDQLWSALLASIASIVAFGVSLGLTYSAGTIRAILFGQLIGGITAIIVSLVRSRMYEKKATH